MGDVAMAGDCAKEPSASKDETLDPIDDDEDGGPELKMALPDWLQKLLQMVSHKELATMAASADYMAWLRAELGEHEHESAQSLAKLSCDASRMKGWRTVTPVTVSEKATAFTRGEAWVGPPAVVLSDGFFEEGHQRVVALHFIFYFHWTAGADVPQWAKVLGRAVPCRNGTGDSKEARVKGLVRASSSLHGTTSFTVYDVISLVEDLTDVSMDAFQQMIAAKLPDLCQNEAVFPWKRMRAIHRRVAKQSINRIVDLTSSLGGADVFPPQWFRDPRCLLPGTRCTRNQSSMTPLSQELFVARVISEIKGILTKQGVPADGPVAPLEMRKLVPGISRSLSEDRRTHLREMAMLFHDGVFGSRFTWSEAERMELIDQFANGACDSAMKHSPSNPSAWPAVRKIVAAKKAHEEVEAPKLLIAGRRQEMKRQRVREELAARRAALAKAADQQDENTQHKFGHLVSLRESRMAERHLQLQGEIEKKLASAQAVLVVADENQQKDFDAKVARSFRFHNTVVNETCLPDEWSALMADKRVVYVLDYNSLDGGNLAAIPAILQSLLEASIPDQVVAILLPVGAKVSVAEMMILKALMELERAAFHFSFQLKEKPSWSDSSCLNGLLISGEVTDWVTSVVGRFQSQPGKTTKVSFLPTLRGDNRHMLGSVRHCFGEEFWSEFLQKVEGAQVLVDLEFGQAQLLDALQSLQAKSGAAESFRDLMYLCTTLQHHSPARRDAVVRKFAKPFESSMPPNSHPDSSSPSLSEFAVEFKMEVPPELAELYTEMRKEVNGKDDASAFWCARLQEQNAPRKIMTREPTQETRVFSKLPPSLQMASGLMPDITLYPSIFRDQLSVIPCRDFMPGEIVMTIKGPWTHTKEMKAKQEALQPNGSKSLLLQFCNEKSVTLSLSLSLENSAAKFLHSMDDQENHPLKSELTLDWRLSTSDDPWLLLRAKNHVTKFGAELAIRWPQEALEVEASADTAAQDAKGLGERKKAEDSKKRVPKRPAQDGGSEGQPKRKARNNRLSDKDESALDNKEDAKGGKSATETKQKKRKASSQEEQGKVREPLAEDDDDAMLEGLLDPLEDAPKAASVKEAIQLERSEEPKDAPKAASAAAAIQLEKSQDAPKAASAAAAIQLEKSQDAPKAASPAAATQLEKSQDAPKAASPAAAIQLEKSQDAPKDPKAASAAAAIQLEKSQDLSAGSAQSQKQTEAGAVDGAGPRKIIVNDTVDFQVVVTPAADGPVMALKAKSSKKKSLAKDTLLYRAAVPSPVHFKAEEYESELPFLLTYKLSKASRVMMGVVEQTLGAAIDERDIQFIDGIGALKKHAIPKNAFQEPKFVVLEPPDMCVFHAASSMDSLGVKFEFCATKKKRGEEEIKALELKAIHLVCEKRTSLVSPAEDVE